MTRPAASLHRRLADRVMAGLAGALVRVFFSDLEVTGAASVPADGPVMVVANHHNGLVDGLVLIAALRRYPRFLGKSTLWRILPLRPFLALAGVVPIYRAADDGPAPSGAAGRDRVQRNDDAFARCRHLLAAGGMVAVFPEGISHDEPHLQAVRTGVARIVLGAAADDAVGGISVVPAGLVYDDKAIFRSRALVRFGTARPVGPAVAAYRSDPGPAVHALTDEVAADLRAVAPDFVSADLAARCLFLADLLVDGTAGRGDLSERERAADELARRSRRPADRDGFERVWSAALRYRRDLAVAGLDDEQVTAAVPGARQRAVLAWSAFKVALAAPLAVVGVAVHAVPYGIIKAVGARPANVGMRSTVKLLGCFGLFVLTYLGVGWRVASRRGLRAGATAALAAPCCGWVALLSGERLDRMGGIVRTVDAVRHRQASRTSLRASRALVVADVTALLAVPAQELDQPHPVV